MNRLGLLTGADIRAQTLDFLQQHFGKSGGYYYWVSRGIDHRPVRPDRIRKSIGAENTFFEDLWTEDSAREKLAPIIDKVWRHYEHHDSRARTLTLKVKFADFQVLTRSQTVAPALTSRDMIVATTYGLLAPFFPTVKGIRLLGISVSAFAETAAPERQLALSI